MTSFLNPEEMTERQERLFQTLVFMVKLVSAGLVFQLILKIYPDTSFIQAYLADLISLMLNSSGFQSETQGVFIQMQSSSQLYEITQDCLGWKSVAAFIGLMFASTKRTLEHAHFLIQGVALILIANVIRVYTTVILAEKGVISFNLIHDVLWSWSLTLLVLVIWLYWMLDLKERKPVFRQRIDKQVEKLRQR